MLRTSAARLLAASTRRAPIRPLSTTAPAFIRIRKPDGSTTDGTGSTPRTQPSPAEKPADVPKDIPNPAPFEPIVSQPMATPKAEPAPESEPIAPAVPPSEPPAPEKPSSAETAAAEAEAIPDKPDLSKLPSLDIDMDDVPPVAPAIEQPKDGAKGKGKKGGARKRPEYVSSQDERRRTMARLGYAALAVGGLAGFWYVSNKEDELGKKDDRPILEKLKGNITDLSDYFSKPAFTKLLPDALPPPYGRPYTLIVDLEDLLVHSSWDRQHGWRTAKRPGVDYFLSYMSQFYEVVLFTSQPSYVAIAVAEKLDPFTLYLPYKLFRESTRFVDGKAVKDLSYLNRDLSKVVMLDTKSDHVALQPENAIIMKPWDGKAGDKGLVEMIPFLESIGIYAPADVRPVLQNYAGKDIPREYAKVEAAAKEAAIREWEARNPTAAGGGSFLSGIFGGSAAPRPTQPMTYLEIKRAQAQRQHQEEQNYYKEHHDEFMKMIEDDKLRFAAETKGSIMGMFGGATPPAETAAAPAGATEGKPKAV